MKRLKYFFGFPLATGVRFLAILGTVLSAMATVYVIIGFGIVGSKVAMDYM